MKKLAIATAIAAAAAFSTGAHAVVSSSIGPINLVTSGFDISIDCSTANSPGFATGLALKGVGKANDEIRFVGTVCLDPSLGFGPDVALVFTLTGEEVAGGTNFDNGRVDIYVDTNSGWAYYSSVDASVTNIPCLASANSTGLQWTATPGTNTLPGYPAVNGAVCQTTLFGMPSDLYLTGTNSW